MADSGTNPVRPNTFELEADVNVEFNEAASRQQINSGESVKTLFGKLRKFLTDLKAVAFTGAYSDLSGVPDLSEYAKTADVPNIKVNAAVDADTVGGLAANEIATNPNLLINPDFKINQRGNTDFSVSYHTGSPIPQSQVYTVDRWRIMDGKANISNGKYVLNGTIIQVLENSIGGNFTASVSVESGTATASYNDSTKTFTIVGNNAVLNWAKLEYGSNATQFFPPDTATELLKCKRYFEVINRVCRALSPDDCWIEGMIFDVPKRIIPSISITSSAGTPNTLSTYTGADSTITLSGMPNVGFDRVHGSPCNQAIGYNGYSYTCKADAEIY